jgi:hypothetical protein
VGEKRLEARRKGKRAQRQRRVGEQEEKVRVVGVVGEEAAVGGVFLGVVVVLFLGWLRGRRLLLAFGVRQGA